MENKYKNYTKSDLEQTVGSEVVNAIYEAIVEMTDVDRAYEQVLRIICEQIIK
ncbi:MAG: hypothetical protein WC933_02795 [Candidatus Paceibacterota bacterium]|jgi:hypothetical protein